MAQTLKLFIARSENLSIPVSLEHFMKAISIQGIDEEILAMCHWKIGLIYSKVKFVQAEKHLNFAKNFGSRKEEFQSRPWFLNTKKTLQEVQNKKKNWTKFQKPIFKVLEEIWNRSTKLNEKIEELIATFPPSHMENFQAKIPSVMKGEEKYLKKIIFLYHPDKISEDSEDEHKVICEEIAKFLSSKLN